MIRKLDDIDRQKAAAIFAGENTAGVDSFTTPAVEAEDAVSLRDGKPAFNIGELAPVRLARADLLAVRVCAAALALVLLKSPSPSPHTQYWFGFGEGNAFDFRSALQLGEQRLPIQPRGAGLPINAWDCGLVEYLKGGKAGAQ